jgi:membrane-bound serine protease (ClpP class)
MSHVAWTTVSTLRRGVVCRRFFGVLLLLVGMLSVLTPVTRSQSSVGDVYVVQVHGEIDLGLAPYLARILDEAERENGSAVVLDINTPGGRLDAALQMRQALLDSPVRTIAYVNRDAFSAGALIAIAANNIYMAPGAVMGAATPVTGDGETASAKTISAVRSTFRSTAEIRGRDPMPAEAMVDPAVSIDGLVESGQLLTLSTNDAVTRGYADAVVANRQELLQAAGLSEAAVRETAPAFAEKLVRFITNPVVASLMMTAGLLLILADLFGAGNGASAAAGVGFISIFFWGHMLAGLAGWEGVALVGLGIALLALEAFVIPGFGIAGILGLVAFVGGLFISLIGGEIVTSADLVRASTTVAATFVALIVGGTGLAWLLLRLNKTGGLVLQARLGLANGHAPHTALTNGSSSTHTEASADGHRSAARPASVRGVQGVALSDLRPAGFARINGRRMDVVTQGDYLPAGTILEIVQDDGYRLVVRRFDASQGEATRPRSRSLV